MDRFFFFTEESVLSSLSPSSDDSISKSSSSPGITREVALALLLLLLLFGGVGNIVVTEGTGFLRDKGLFGKELEEIEPEGGAEAARRFEGSVATEGAEDEAE